jgi:hypothetical protein
LQQQLAARQQVTAQQVAGLHQQVQDLLQRHAQGTPSAGSAAGSGERAVTRIGVACREYAV